MDRLPYPFIQMNPQDMAELRRQAGRSGRGLQRQRLDPGDGLSDADAPSAKQTFMLFAYPTGVQGNVVSPGVNEFIIPNYKQTWGDIRKIADAPEGVRHLTSSRRNTRPDTRSEACGPDGLMGKSCRPGSVGTAPIRRAEHAAISR